MSASNPDRPTLISGSERKAFRDMFRDGRKDEIPQEYGPPVPVYSYLGKALADVDTNGSGPFHLQAQRPGDLEDGELSVTAYALRDFKTDDVALLVWIITSGPGGGYWLAVGAGEGKPSEPSGGELCFKPCDLFTILDSLQLDSDSQALLDGMKEDCECEDDPAGSGPCENCPEIPANPVLLLGGATVDFGKTPELIATPFQPVKGFAVALRAPLDSTARQQIVDGLLFRMSNVSPCLWTGVASVDVQLDVIDESGFGEDGLNPDPVLGDYPDRRTFTITFTATLKVEGNGKWYAEIFTTSIFDERNGSDDVQDNWRIDGGVVGGNQSYGTLFNAFTDSFAIGTTDCGTRDAPAKVNTGVLNADTEGFNLGAADFELAYTSAVVLPPPPTPLTDYINKTYFYNPGSVQNGTIFPLPESPSDNDFVKVVFGGLIDYGNTVVNNLSFSGGTVFGEFPASISSGTAITLQYSADFDRWYVV